MSIKNDFFEDDRAQQEHGPRKDTFMDSVDRFLWKALAPEANHIPVLNMSDVIGFFLKLTEKEPRGNKCLLHIEEKRKGYEVLQVLLDDKEEPLRKTTKAFYGRKIIADRLDESVKQYMNGAESKILNKPKFD